jgi:UDP-glucose 4-epimerase
VKILVTGGAGFIGSHVVDGYIHEGHDVVVIDDLSSGKKDNVNQGARFYEVDIRSAEVRAIFERERPDVVNHHAAQISVTASVADPLYDADVNIRGFLNVMESARYYQVRKVIFISSGGAIYGEATEYPTTEQYEPKPLSPYAISKMVAEDYLYFYWQQYGMNYTVLRYSNIYGPRQIPHGEAGVIAIFMDNLLEGKACSLFHFPDEPRGMTRDYCYVGDIVKANILALEKGDNDTLNIGTGHATHTSTLFDHIYEGLIAGNIELAPISDLLIREGARPGELSRSCLDVNKANEILGWKAEVDIGSGIKKTLDWRVP